MNSLFNFAHAIYDDRSDNTQRTNQNAQHVNYMLNNHIDDRVGNDARGVALNHQMVFIGGNGHGIPTNNSSLSASNSLTIDRDLIRQRERLSLIERPFMTIPYMGKGNTDPDVESALLQAGELPEKKSQLQASEANLSGMRNYPLQDEILGSITNPNFLVEESADKNWIRGGLSSRNLSHDINNN